MLASHTRNLTTEYAALGAGSIRNPDYKMPEPSTSIDKLITFQNSQGDAARGTLLSITRSNIAFEVYNPYSIVQLSEVLQDLTVRRGDGIIYVGRAVVSSLVNTGLMLIVSATLVDNWNDLALGFAQRIDMRREIERFVGDWEEHKRIQPGYQIAVGEMRSFLTQLSQWVVQVDIEQDPVHVQLPQDVFEQLTIPLLPKVQELQQNFEYEAKRLGQEEFEGHKLFAQRDLLPLMMRAPFFHRSYTKPLGYAGDYVMVELMVMGRREGPNTYAQIVNDFFLKIGLVAAHRNRLKILESKLTELARNAAQSGETVRVLNIGCGPAIEIQRFISSCEFADRCSFELIDFNEETIEYAKSKIAKAIENSGRKIEINFTQESVHNLLKQASAREGVAERDFDFVYCAGLFDYLSDRICQRLLSLFAQWTSRGGLVLVTNVHPDNPTRYIMELVVDWHLIHRTMEDLAALAPPGHSIRTFDDETRLNVFLEIEV